MKKCAHVGVFTLERNKMRRFREKLTTGCVHITQRQLFFLLLDGIIRKALVSLAASILRHSALGLYFSFPTCTSFRVFTKQEMRTASTTEGTSRILNGGYTLIVPVPARSVRRRGERVR